MPQTLKELETAARELSTDEQILLAENLISGLPENKENEKRWIETAERRAREIIAGTARCFDGEEVMAEADAIINEKI